MKKFFLLSLVLIALLASAACGGSATPPPPSQAALDAAQQALAAVNASDLASVLLAHFAARSVYNVASSMQLVAPDAVFTYNGDASSGTDAVQEFIQDRADKGFQFEVTDLQVSGDSVTFTVQVTQAGKDVTTLAGKAVILNGLISSLETNEK